MRSFDGRKITDEDLAKIKEYAAGIEEPFGIPVRFVFLDAEEYGLSSPVLSAKSCTSPGSWTKSPMRTLLSDTHLKSWSCMPGPSV